MDWSGYLNQRAREIVRYGQGELRMVVTERQGKFTSIQIFAGERRDFLIEKVIPKDRSKIED